MGSCVGGTVDRRRAVKSRPPRQYGSVWISIVLMFGLALALIGGCVYLWWRNRKLKRELDEMVGLAMLNQETNYHLACQVYGRSRVDGAIAREHSKGRN